LTFQSIGKEVDNIEERGIIGDEYDEVAEYLFTKSDESKMVEFVKTLSTGSRSATAQHRNARRFHTVR